MLIKSFLKKYKYFTLSIFLHLSIFILVFFEQSTNMQSLNISFNTNGSKGVSLVKVSILQKKGNVKHQLQNQGSLEKSKGKSKDESYVKSIIEDQSLLDYKAPKYPKVALLNKQEGEVIVRLLVDKSGQIKKIIIYKSSNYHLLDNEVLDVAKHWNIKRSLEEISWVQVRVKFIIQ